MTRPDWRPSDEYDDKARWLDDHDGGNRWLDYKRCHDVDSDLFFPSTPVVDAEGVIVREDEPATPPDDVRRICGLCPVAGRCLERNIDAEFGIFGGTTGYQRGLMTKKIKRKRCPGCGSTDVVKTVSQRDEICTACGISWPVL